MPPRKRIPFENRTNQPGFWAPQNQIRRENNRRFFLQPQKQSLIQHRECYPYLHSPQKRVSKKSKSKSGHAATQDILDDKHQKQQKIR